MTTERHGVRLPPPVATERHGVRLPPPVAPRSHTASPSASPSSPKPHDTFGRSMLSSVDALHRRHQEELDLLENFRVLVHKRARADAQYAQELIKIQNFIKRPPPKGADEAPEVTTVYDVSDDGKGIDDVWDCVCVCTCGYVCWWVYMCVYVCVRVLVGVHVCWCVGVACTVCACGHE